MQLHVINTGMFKLDGGAMFGVVPKSIWQKLNPADENNMCTWAMRCLLIEDGNRLILIDTGLGDKQDQRFFSFYYLHGEDSLIGSIQNAGYSPDQVTDVVLTHLHFDHCGGALKYNEDRSRIVPTFKNATYWSHSQHWQWAADPNPREKASFLKDNILPLQESGQLKFLDQATQKPFNNIGFLSVDGHTEKQIIPHIRYKDKTIAYVADLFPSSWHIPLPYVMAYDTRPLLTMEEKENFLNKAAAENYFLFFEHDPMIECCNVQHTEKGVRMKESFNLRDIL
ncbi:MAG: MBL fold metallo-hydrolase [Cytophagaceae bacterium]|nr:MBL fold metallo-hydrolase [Cytophagaceae bacterium]